MALPKRKVHPDWKNKRGTVSKAGADEIMHHTARCHEVLRREKDLDVFEMADLGELLDKFRDAIKARIAVEGEQNG